VRSKKRAGRRRPGRLKTAKLVSQRAVPAGNTLGRRRSHAQERYRATTYIEFLEAEPTDFSAARRKSCSATAKTTTTTAGFTQRVSALLHQKPSATPDYPLIPRLRAGSGARIVHRDAVDSKYLPPGCESSSGLGPCNGNPGRVIFSTVDRLIAAPCRSTCRLPPAA